MKKLLLTTAIALCLASPAIAGKTPHPGSADARVKTIVYHDTDVFRITGHYGFSTVLEFDARENIETIALGDSQAWQTIKPGRGNLLFIKPLEQNANTNMTVITNKRIYTFELTARSAQSHKSPNLSFRIKFVYPDQIDMQLANINKMQNNGFDPANFAPSPVPADQWNFDYSYSGDKRLRPARAFDDGTFTYLQFSKNEVTPAVFAVDENGNESIVNYSMKGKYLVVESLGRQFTLRDGDTTVCIFNDAYPAPEIDPLEMTLNKLDERIAANTTKPRTYNK
ncbi:MAG: P-type conjugative transfer protein VirB9 [Alphaproteobacteria bacterium]|nr:MAG: P-type conjugative transfer protein VirB9 [Alphaproteobacteria bacterium]